MLILKTDGIHELREGELDNVAGGGLVGDVVNVINNDVLNPVEAIFETMVDELGNIFPKPRS